jgi:hypothetical protein
MNQSQERAYKHVCSVAPKTKEYKSSPGGIMLLVTDGGKKPDICITQDGRVHRW